MQDIRLFIVFFLAGMQPFQSDAQENHPAGARSLGLSHASVSFSDTWSVFHNQAGMAGLNTASAGLFFESRFGVKELTLSAGSAITPLWSGTFGVSFFQFGRGSFKESKYGVAYALKLAEKWSAGVQLGYLSQTFRGDDRANGATICEGGILFQPGEYLHLGVHLFHPAPGLNTLSGKTDLSAIFRGGGHYRFDEMVLATFEAEKEKRYPARIKTGIEFLPANNLALRMGVSGRPFNYTSGFGYRSGNFSTDIAFSYHGDLGITPSVSLQIFL